MNAFLVPLGNCVFSLGGGKLMRTSGIFLSVALIAASPGGSAIAQEYTDYPTATDSTQWFQRPHFDVTSGRVGYHLVSNLQYYGSEFPPECRSDHDVRVHEADIDGTLPPGLTADPPTNFEVIQGTPRQPGDWSYTVALHGVWCHGQYYGDRRVEVRFHVDP